ncbi:MAG: hypothetical protein EA396_01535 [Anaerolineaceae bacterium]|nr:MAG: hypothetical protein EA396_01535 [Anaerolineaceae bacterium]
MRRLIFALSAAFALILAFDLYPGLRGGGGWRWTYQQAENPLALAVLVGVLAVYIGGVIGLRRRGVALRLAWGVLAGVLIAYSAVAVRGDALELLLIRTLSPVQTGASTVAVRYMAEDGVGETLERWPDVMREAGERNIIHFTTSPPGQPLIHYALAGIVGDGAFVQQAGYALRAYQCSNLGVMIYDDSQLLSAALVGWSMPLWAALMIVPVYFAARRLFDDTAAALQTAAWSPLIPTIILFAPVWNTLYPALIALCVALLLTGLPLREGEHMRPSWLVLAGAVMSGATFLNFAVLPVLLTLGLLTLGVVGFRRGVIAGIGFGVGLLACWIPFAIASNLTPLDLWAVTAEKHGELVAGRDYLTWLILHPYDTLLFIGWPLVALLVWRVMRLRWTTRTPSDVLVVALVVTFVALNVSGMVQGENGRILSFYAPFVILAAGGMIAVKSAEWGLPLLVAQAGLLAVMAGVLAVVPQDLDSPPRQPRGDVARLDDFTLHPTSARFDASGERGHATLEAHRFVADVGAQVITLETVWRGGERTAQPYWIEVSARAENDIDGEIIVPPQRWTPQNGNYLPTCWRDGQTIIDTQAVHLPTISAPVVWTLELRLVNPATGAVMAVTLPDGTTADHVRLAPVNYP